MNGEDCLGAIQQLNTCPYLRGASIIVEAACGSGCAWYSWTDALNLESVGEIDQLGLGVGIVEFDGCAADGTDTQVGVAVTNEPAAEPAEAAALAALSHEVGEGVVEVPAIAAAEVSCSDEALAAVDIPAVADAALAHFD